MNRTVAIVGGAIVGGGLVYLLAGPVKRKVSSIVLNAAKGSIAVQVRHLRRYAFASSQDISPVVGITHASYALNALDTLEEMIGQEGIRGAGYDPVKLRAFITGLQDQHAKKLQPCDAHLQQVLAIEKNDVAAAQTPGSVVAGASMWGDDAYSAPMGA